MNVCKKCGEEFRELLSHVRDKHSEQEYRELVQTMKDFEETENELEAIYKRKAQLKAEMAKIEQDIQDDISRIVWK